VYTPDHLILLITTSVLTSDFTRDKLVTGIGTGLYIIKDLY